MTLVSFFQSIDRYFSVPDAVKPTYERDLRYGISKGFVLAGSASVAGIILKKTFQSSDFEVALVHSSVSVGFLLSIFLASKAGQSRTMDYAYYPDAGARWLFILTGLVSWLFPVSWVFTVILCFAYALNSLNTPVITSIYRTNYPNESRGRIMGIVRTFYNIAFVAASYVFGLLLELDGDNYIYVYPIIGLVGIWGVNHFRKIQVASFNVNNGAQEHPIRQSVRVLKTDKPFAQFMLYWAVFGFAVLMIDPVKTIYVTDLKYGINATYEEAVLAVAVIPQAVMLLTFPFWGKQIDRFGVIKIRFILNILPTISVLLFYFAADLKLIYIASVLQGISMSGATLSWQVCVMEFAPKHQVGFYMGIHTMLTGMRGIVAPFAGAYLISAAGIGNTFLIGFGFMVISTLLMMNFSQHHSRRPDDLEFVRYGEEKSER